MKHPIKHYFEYIFIIILSQIIRFIPERFALCVGWVIAATFHFIFQFRKKEAILRINQVFKNKLTKKEIKKIAWVSWRNLCFNAIDMIRYKKLISASATNKAVENKFLFIENHLSKNKKGFIAATAHIGNWELSAILMNISQLPVFSIAKKQKNKLVDAYINKSRGTFDMEMLFSDDISLKKVIRKINEGNIFIILPDVRHPQPSLDISFLGGRANLGAGAAAFAYNCDCPIIPFVMNRIGWNKHQVKSLEPIYPDKSLEKEDAYKFMMQKLMRLFSEEIMSNPEQYFWYNKRWVLEPINNKD